MSDNAINFKAFVVAFRILVRSNGEPDFTEAFCTLNHVAGDKNWTPCNETPDFKVREINGASIYTMDIFVNPSALDILKLNDVIRDEIRVLDDRNATSEELAKVRHALVG